MPVIPAKVQDTFLIAMRRTLLLILIGVCAFAALPPLLRKMFPPKLPDAQLVIHETPRPVTNFQFSDGSGRVLTLSDFRGKLILVNVWATWCAPCKEEMASLNRLATLLAGKNTIVIPISIDISGVITVQSFYERSGLNNLSIYVDPSMQVMNALRIIGIPTTLLIDRDGNEIARMVGPAQWDTPESVKRISVIGRL